MELAEYQSKAALTDLHPNSKEGLLISLLGISGEAGELLNVYKKHLRDGEAFTIFDSKIAEELGDILWYLTDIATKSGITLEKIAHANLQKINQRWSMDSSQINNFDQGFPESQKLPLEIIFCIKEKKDALFSTVVTYYDDIQVGDPLTDNTYHDDGYRFHDVFHMSYLAVLGWSPVLRKHLFKKRKSNLKIDEVEDGGRAIVIEEGIAALVYSYAKDHNWLEGVNFVDDDLLKTIKKMTAHLEIKNVTEKQWEDTILQGYLVWREFQINKEGLVIVDMKKRELNFAPLGNGHCK